MRCPSRQATQSEWGRHLRSIMDDLATTERSRWELWAEVHHGRVSLEDFERWLKDEALFIQANQDTGINGQVRWQERLPSGTPSPFSFFTSWLQTMIPLSSFPRKSPSPSISFEMQILSSARKLHPRYQHFSTDWLSIEAAK